jgi:hypothetical protein
VALLSSRMGLISGLVTFVLGPLLGVFNAVGVPGI